MRTAKAKLDLLANARAVARRSGLIKPLHPGDRLSQSGDSRTLEQVAQRQVNTGARPKIGHESRRHQRIAAEVKEIVEHAKIGAR